MKRSAVTFLATGLLALTAAVPAAAQDDDPPPVVQYRVDVMQGVNAHRGALAAILSEEAGTADHVLGHAQSLYDLAMMASDIFPEGSGGEGSRARPEIWTNSADFAEAVAAFQGGAATLLEAAQGGNMATIQEAADDFQSTCAGCHRPFRARGG